ncbi:hypothetical protein [Undibacterium griseum]|uniref:HNH endonuclease n=1 Tax=Undibacterium griseum TaxID=2762295 RepID=A0ABR6YK66_9BURK|nr:hypothetical protein [Undibacterium griseum]MBC3884203.1 hypothetical protein [Undibacterium griseum]
MPLCAYCKQEGSITREHIIPAFIYAFQKNIESSVIGWSEIAGKMVRSEFKVKDVCKKCNNGPLSDLDAFGKRFLTCSGVMVPNYTKLSVNLSFDFDLLARWLLKISFNSARTNGEHAWLFDGFESYILGTSKVYPPARFAIISYLARPEQLDELQRNRPPYVGLTDKNGRFNPFIVRISKGTVPWRSSYTLRSVILGPLVFYIVMFPPSVLPGHAASAVRNLIKCIPGGKLLKSTERFVELRSGLKTWLDLYENQVIRMLAI